MTTPIEIAKRSDSFVTVTGKIKRRVEPITICDRFTEVAPVRSDLLILNVNQQLFEFGRVNT